MFRDSSASHYNGSMPTQWIVSSSQRLDAFLANENPNVSRSRIQKVILSGGIEVNGEEVTKVSRKLAAGDTVYLSGEWEEAEVSEHIIPADLRLPVLFEDEDCMVLNKPAGIAVHPGTGMSPNEKTILHGVAHMFSERNISFESSAVLVHRLDKDTTGCLLIAKNREAHSLLQKQFEKRDVSKFYLAIVAGTPSPEKAVIDAPIGRNLTDRTKMSVLRTSVSREARTTYHTLNSSTEASLVQCEIHTGRTHQIRVHLSSIGHPILGDFTYYSPTSSTLSQGRGITTICLHAWKLRFLSVSHVKEIAAEAPLPESFTSAMEIFHLTIRS